jgi:glutamyl-tRNA reductase
VSNGQPWVLGVTAAERSVDERERIARRFRAWSGSAGAGVVLSTCHRVELYGTAEPPALEGELPLRQGEAAVTHLLRVAAGLESAVVGEDEVLHQVRDALRDARATHSLDPRLHRLFELAVGAGRRARAGRTGSEAGLAVRAISWLNARISLKERPVLIVGAGRMGSALARAAGREGATVTISSRDPGRARRLAHGHGGEGLDLVEGARRVASSAAVAVALSGPWEEISSHQGQPPPIADISSPSALPREFRERLNGSFLGVDELFSGGGSPPAGYVEEARRIVAAKSDEYLRWLAARS